MTTTKTSRTTTLNNHHPDNEHDNEPDNDKKVEEVDGKEDEEVELHDENERLETRYSGSKNCSNVCSFANDCIGIEC